MKILEREYVETLENLLFSVRPEHEIREERESEVEARQKRIALVREALKTLTPKQKEILILVHLKDMTQEEVADALCVSRRTVREQLYAAEKKFKKVFENTRHFTP